MQSTAKALLRVAITGKIGQVKWRHGNFIMSGVVVHATCVTKLIRLSYGGVLSRLTPDERKPPPDFSDNVNNVLAVRKEIERGIVIAPRTGVLGSGRALILAGAFGSVVVANEHQPSGRIRGVTLAVTSDRRERLPRVTLVLTGSALGDNKLETISDEQGEYSFNHLAGRRIQIDSCVTGLQDCGASRDRRYRCDC
jgi:hypothetical protein